MYDNKDTGQAAPLGQQIRASRQARGWTLQQLARRAGTSAPTVHRYENGWSRFELRTLRKIATALGTRLDVRLTPVERPGAAKDGAVPTKRALREMLAPLFWDTELELHHLEENRDWVLARILTYGDRRQVTAVRERFGDDAIRRAVRRRGIDRRTRNYWATVLGEEEQVHPKVLGKTAWTLVKALVAGEIVTGWTLAGGTGLALQFGHRVSEDLDFFRVEGFEPEKYADALSKHGRVAIQDRSPGTLHAAVGGIRISFLQLESELLFPGTRYRGLTIADPRDIAVMKVVAIGGRGSRKDFVDLHFLIQNGVQLDATFECLRRRFSRVDYNEYHLMKSLVYFDDAETEPMPRMLREVSWDEIRRTIRDEVRRLA